MVDGKITATSGTENERGNALGSAAELRLSAQIKNQIVQTKATCPFIGTAVATDVLPVRNNADNPLASLSATSGWFSPAAPGTYYWTARYNGDANNNQATSPCSAPNESVTVVWPSFAVAENES